MKLFLILLIIFSYSSASSPLPQRKAGGAIALSEKLVTNIFNTLFPDISGLVSDIHVDHIKVGKELSLSNLEIDIYKESTNIETVFHKEERTLELIIRDIDGYISCNY